MQYVDGFVVPVPKKQLPAYRSMAKKAGKVWRDHGALEFREYVAEDVKVGKWTSFPQSVKLKAGETVVFSWIAWTGSSVGLANRSGLTVLRSTGPLRKADLRSCMFKSESGSIGGVSVCPVGGAVFCSVALGVTAGAVMCSLVPVVANRWLVRAASFSCAKRCCSGSIGIAGEPSIGLCALSMGRPRSPGSACRGLPPGLPW